MNSKKILVGLLTLSFSQLILADTTLFYPELEVTPRASERLNMLVNSEKQNHLFSQLPMQLSAVSTLSTGLLQLGSIDDSKDKTKSSAYVGIAVGGGWLGLNYLIAQKLDIYQNTLIEVNRIVGKTPRDQLMRERIAEEGINKAARLAVRLKWMSTTTNFVANAYMLGKVKKETAAQYMGVFSLISSFAPILFVSEWETVAADQNAYKKKVYGPIFSTGLFDTGNGKVTPGFLLTARF